MAWTSVSNISSGAITRSGRMQSQPSSTRPIATIPTLRGSS